MIPKTLALLNGVAPGTFIPDEQRCFDEAEIEELGRTLGALLYSPSQLRKRLQDFGVSIVPADFYSEVPTVREVEASFESDQGARFDYIFDAELLRKTLVGLIEHSTDFSPPVQPTGQHDFHWGNNQFSYSDAMSYYAMVRQRRPQLIVEVGSGFSTLVASAALAHNGQGEIVCIEPFPRAFLSTTPRVREIIQKPVQELSAANFNSLLPPGGFLFIDSTHTVKHGSDCLHLYCNILPRIDRRITAHAHDIFLPRTFGEEALRDKQIYWTEQYLLHAYLTDNKRTRVVYSSSYNHMHMQPLLDRMMHGRYPSGGGSVWFDQLAPHETADTARS